MGIKLDMKKDYDMLDLHLIKKCLLDLCFLIFGLIG